MRLGFTWWSEEEWEIFLFWDRVSAGDSFRCVEAQVLIESRD
jgi:hypothetical protein